MVVVVVMAVVVVVTMMAMVVIKNTLNDHLENEMLPPTTQSSVTTAQNHSLCLTPHDARHTSHVTSHTSPDLKQLEPQT